MGWSAWEVFRCTTCEQDPENCLSERLIQQTTDAMVSGGFRDAGYKIVWIDDCWQLKQRSASGALVPDPARWPHGLKAVADYVHSKGMLLGLCEPPATDAAGFFVPTWRPAARAAGRRRHRHQDVRRLPGAAVRPGRGARAPHRRAGREADGRVGHRCLQG